MKYKTLLLASLLIAGCASLTEQEQYERDDRRSIERDKIAYKLNNCTHSGGILMIDMRNITHGQLVKLDNTRIHTADNLPKNIRLMDVRCVDRSIFRDAVDPQ